MSEVRRGEIVVYTELEAVFSRLIFIQIEYVLVPETGRPNREAVPIGPLGGSGRCSPKISDFSTRTKM